MGIHVDDTLCVSHGMYMYRSCLKNFTILHINALSMVGTINVSSIFMYRSVVNSSVGGYLYSIVYQLILSVYCILL